MKSNTFVLEDNSDEESANYMNNLSVETEIQYQIARERLTHIFLAVCVNITLPITCFLQYLQYVKIKNEEDTISIETNIALLRQFLNYNELKETIKNTHLNEILSQSYQIDQLKQKIKQLELNYNSHLSKTYPILISKYINILYDKRENENIQKNLKKSFEDQNFINFSQQIKQKLKQLKSEVWKNNTKIYTEVQQPLQDIATNIIKFEKYLIDIHEEEQYNIGKKNRKQNQMIRVVRRIIKKRRPKTKNELFCTQVHSRRFIKRLFQLLLSKHLSYPEIFYCLTIKFEKDKPEKIQFTPNTRFKQNLENDKQIHELLNKQLIETGQQPVQLQDEMDMFAFFHCFDLSLTPKEVSEAKVVYDMIVEVYAHKEEDRLRLYEIFTSGKFKFLEQQLAAVDIANKFQTAQFLKFKQITEDIKYYLETNKIMIEQDIKYKNGDMPFIKQNKLEKVEPKLEF